MIKYYFTVFPTSPKEKRRRQAVTATPQQQFEAFYTLHFGRQWFAWSLAVYMALVAVLLVWSVFSVGYLIDLKTAPNVPSKILPAVAMAAIMGGYARTVWDGVAAWFAANLSPADLLWFALRMAIAVPLGYSVTALPFLDPKSS